MATYAEVLEEIGESGFDLLDRMVELHLNRRQGSRAEFLWVKSDSLASDHTSLVFTGSTARALEIDHDPVDFQALLDFGLVRRASGRNAYRLGPEARRFHRAVIESRGESPIEQIETHVRSMLTDPQRLSSRHASAARHLKAAFDALWDDPFDDRSVINVGGELRSALAAMAVDLVGYEGDVSPEQVAAALKPWLHAEGRLPPRTPELMFELLRWAAKAAQRLNHLHDERATGTPEPTRAEVRRTAFAVGFVLYELDALSGA